MYNNFYVPVTIVTILMVLIIIYIYSHRKEKGNIFEDIGIGNLKNEDLQSLAVDMSQNYSEVVVGNCKKRLISSLDNSFGKIIESHKVLNKEYNSKKPVVQGSDWLLDNVYLVEKEYEDIKFNMPKKYFKELPIAVKGVFKGYPRVYNIAVELVSHTEGRIDEEILFKFLKYYQQNTNLTIGELWALPIMLRIALVQNISNVCLKMIETQNERTKANIIGEKIISTINDGVIESEFSKLKEEHIKFTYHFTERLIKILRDNGINNEQISQWLNDKLSENDINIEKIIFLSQRKEAKYSISMGNSINSLRLIESLNWKEIFESNSKVDEILVKDPIKVYEAMDFNSRDFYRHKLEKIAKQNGIAESYVARKVLECAIESEKEYERHVGYYLLDEGIERLNKKLNISYKGIERLKAYIKGKAVSFYVTTIVLLTFITMSIFIIWSYFHDSNLSVLKYFIAALVIAIPLSEVIISILNWSITHLVSPSIIPKLEFKNGISQEVSTAVIIPTIISDEKRSKELVESMEQYYLSNKEENLYFVLLGDYKDSEFEVNAEDDDISKCCIYEVEKLNKKYCDGNNKKFFFLCRHRVFNKKENTWIGWERKRGKIEEFNKLLKGDSDTTYTIRSSTIENLKKVKYIITLDADTILPRETAKTLISAMAHPLNKPYFDENGKKIIRGYGLMQPRISVSVLSANKTYFSKIFSGETGLDIYTTAVSDIYQDLFGEGIFTGKGIYDIDIFNTMLSNNIPDNTVLSHDLLEGSYVRTALLTDVELIDGYPAYYMSSFKRLHRWVRGDWQLLPWLYRKIPINRLSKWKIIDNLRRSLIAPSMVILLILSLLGILPDGTDKWYMATFIALVTPILFDVSEHVVTPMKGISLSGKIDNAKMVFKQVFFIYVFLPFQSYLMADAILRTIYRVYISKEKLLQWQTAEDVEKSTKKSIGYYISSMWVGSVISIAILLCSYINGKEVFLTMLPSCVLWFISPLIAYLISKERNFYKKELNTDDKLVVRRIGRKTWAYFEDFVCEATNYLGVDNYQEDPPNGIAHRTSPTNLGMGLISNIVAYDLGYIGIIKALDRIKNSLDSMSELERYKGHYYNWYDTNTKKPLYPRYISTVDSGNLIGYLYTIEKSIDEYLYTPYFTKRFAGISDTLDLAASELEKIPTKKYIYLKIYDELLLNTYNIFGYLEILNNLKTRVEETLQEEVEEKYWNKKLLQDISDQLLEINNFFPFLEEVKSLDGFIKDDFIYALENVNLKELPKHLFELKKKHKLNDNTIKSGIEQINSTLNKAEIMKNSVNKLAGEMEFSFLYDEGRGLFTIGYNLENDSGGKSYYDLLASESRISSFIAIARGEVPKAHWYKLSRALTYMGKKKGLVSWSGTMFEYFMPRLILKNFHNTLWNETYNSVLKAQISYCKSRLVPFGISESAYYNFDVNLNYQYKAFGVPGVGLKRGLESELVISPYSTIMALMENIPDSMANLQKLISIGMEGRYGLYEAIDYTKDRVDKDKNFEIIKCYMIHHLGMSLLSINNILNNDILQQRFHSIPMFKSTELLLQEKVSKRVVYKRNKRFEPVEINVDNQNIIPRIFCNAKTVYPQTNLLSNGNYTVMVTNSGGGYSLRNGTLVYRWKEDFTSQNNGLYFYIKDIESGEYFSSTYEPCKKSGDLYEVKFYLHKAEFTRNDDALKIKTTIIVSNEDDSEIRTVSIKNAGDKEKIIEVTSYCEVVLQHYDADIVHPAFGNLFISTEFVENQNCVIATRRPRSEGQSQGYMMQTLLVEGNIMGNLQYDTSRINFIGRGNSKENPIAMEEDYILTNSYGAVIDPIISLRRRVHIKPGESCKFYLVTSIGDSKDEVLALAKKYNDIYNIKKAFELSYNETQLELRYLGIKSTQGNLYQGLASKIIFLNSNIYERGQYIKKLSKAQPALWCYGISGDLPIVLVLVRNEENGDIIRQVIDAHQYITRKGLKFDLVILNLEPASYEQPIHRFIKELIATSHLRDKENISGGVFTLNCNIVPKDDIHLLKAISAMVIDSDNGVLANQISDEIVNEVSSEKNTLKVSNTSNYSFNKVKIKFPEVNYYNGYGGFGIDGKSYFILLKEKLNTPAPWINVISNGSFGFHISEVGSSYTWYKNSRENKLTSWNNDWIVDSPSEALYLRDDESGELWSITPKPIRDDGEYLIEHSFGFSRFTHDANGILGEITMFTPIEHNTKILKVKLKNHSDKARCLSSVYFAEITLGVVREHTYKKIYTSINKEYNFISARNPYNLHFGNVNTYLKILGGNSESFTGDRTEFLGASGSITSPGAMEFAKLSNFSGAGVDPCLAAMSKLEIMPNEEKELTILFGCEENYEDISKVIELYSNKAKVEEDFNEINSYWKGLLGKLQVNTPDKSFDYMLNGWLMYQTIACRLWARTAFYQSGGAYGFRDQLQDVMPIAFIEPSFTRKQILYSASRQFEEGDVQHWWHPVIDSGIRTRFSDDLLWLPYTTCDYIRNTGDYSILDEEIEYLKDEPLKDGEDERYNISRVSDLKESLYKHCIKAIEKALKFGPHNIPLMGSGDWNDGMSTVGNKGKGESVWLGWFLYSILDNFKEICRYKGDKDNCQRYSEMMDFIKENLEENAWDGHWYRRAYFDDGTPLGSYQNEECKIDSLSQSWAVISKAGDKARTEEAMKSLSKHLVKEDKGMIYLLTPPFNKSNLHPGYIKSYIPGVRENGGQYTHAATWVILAYVKMKKNNEAFKLFNLINPINHTKTNISCEVFKTEPYVCTADVYSVEPHVGRGGWSWYTGTSSWFYRVGIEGILGLQLIEGKGFTVEPCVPDSWDKYSIRYEVKKSIYNIEVTRGKESLLTINGEVIKDNIIPIYETGEYDVKISYNDL